MDIPVTATLWLSTFTSSNLKIQSGLLKFIIHRI